MRRSFLASGLLTIAVAIPLCAVELTLPAAASFVGGAPFFSDVRTFNTSYTASLDVTATYRCFIPSPCTAVATPVFTFTLQPRESRAFDNMVQDTFGAPDTAGGVEFDFAGGEDQLVVTSRLYSTAPQPTVGMFIPGLPNSEAHATTVLTSVRNGDPATGFRTNVGVFNGEDSPATVTFTIFDGAQVGNPVPITVPGHSGAQVNAIFNAAGQPTHFTENAFIVVAANHEIFSYAAVIDNRTTDPIFVRGAEDTTSVAVPGVRTVAVGQGGMRFVDNTSGGSTTDIQVGDTVKWVWGGSEDHAVTAGTCTPGGYYGDETCTASGVFGSGAHVPPYEFSYTFTTPGTFPYYCAVHGFMMRGRVNVTAPGAAGAEKKRKPRA